MAKSNSSNSVTDMEFPDIIDGKSISRVFSGYKKGSNDWWGQLNLLLPDGKTCADCEHRDRCAAIYGQKPMATSCQFTPNKFKEVETAVSEPENVLSYLGITDTNKYLLGVLQSIEKYTYKGNRHEVRNIAIVQAYITGFTSKAGASSAHKICTMLGVDPDGKSFLVK